MRRLLVAALLVAFAGPAFAQDKQPPYWASIASGQAMTRTGPAKNYPGVWLYQRRDLPVRVIRKHDNWRLIVDPDGAKGWMLATLLSDRRTALVKPGQPRAIRADASAGSRIRYYAEPGVVGRVDRCSGSWCRIEIGTKRGYIEQSELYGLSPGEKFD